jgi:hypothetical protein
MGINLTWQRVLIFGLSGVVAGLGGTLLTIQQQSVSAEGFNYEFSLAFVVIVVSTGVSTVEGAINAGMAFVVIQQLLTYLPARFGGDSLVFVLFAFGAINYASHPEGVLEFQKRKSTLRMQKRFFKPDPPPTAPTGGALLGAFGNGSDAVGVATRPPGVEPRVVDRG